MSKRLKIFCIVICIILCAVFLGGCTKGEAKKELNSIAIVIGFAVDAAEGKGEEEVLLTAQVVHNSSSLQSDGSGESSSGSGGDLGKSFWNVQSTGGNLLETIRNASHITNRKLYVAHNQVVIFSKEIAEKGVGRYLDHFLRDHETRYDVNIVISDGPAGEVLAVESHLEVLPAQDLNKLILRQEQEGNIASCTIFKFAREYKIPYKSVLVPIVKIIKPEESETKSPYLSVDKVAVFKKGKMVGTFDKEQTRGILWLMGDVMKGVISFEYDEESVTVEVLDGNSKIKPSYKNGKIILQAEINADLSLGEFQSGKKIDQKLLDNLSKACEDKIKNDIVSVFSEIQKYETDILGIGEYFYRFHNKVWDSISENFEELYKNTEIEVSVNVDIIRAGSLLEKADQRGNEQNE